MAERLTYNAIVCNIKVFQPDQYTNHLNS